MAGTVVIALLACVMACQTLGSGAAPSVFHANTLIPTFSTLESRRCLPADFDQSAPLAPGCAAKVTGGGLPATCQGTPLLTLFYNCYATGRGLLTADGTAFDFVPEMQHFIGRSTDQRWNDGVLRTLGQCQKKMDKALTPRQQAVYNYICLKWSLFSDCDRKQEEEGSLDATGALRRVSFLSGECPLSPFSMKEFLERSTNGTFAECYQTPTTVDDPHQKYTAEITRVKCLLQDLTDDSGNLDSSSLKAAMIRELSYSPAALHMLNTVVIPCSSKRGSADPVTTEDFIKCWAGVGQYSCVFQETSQLASQFPNDCAVSA